MYQQALMLYEGKGWTLAEDYIQFCLVKHSFNLHHLLDAKEAFERLLSHACPVLLTSKASPSGLYLCS